MPRSEHARRIGEEPGALRGQPARGLRDALTGKPVCEGGLAREVTSDTRCAAFGHDESTQLVGALFPGLCARSVAPTGKRRECGLLVRGQSGGATLASGPADDVGRDAIAETGEASPGVCVFSDPLVVGPPGAAISFRSGNSA